MGRHSREMMHFAALLVVLVGTVAAAPSKEVLVWMCLERCDFNSSQIEGQLQQIGQLLNDRALTAVNFELFNLGPHSTLVTNNLTAVASRLRAMGVRSRQAMISSYPYP